VVASCAAFEYCGSKSVYAAQRWEMSKNILFITSGRLLGDTVMSTAALNHFVETFPDAMISVACGSAFLPLFSGLPNLGKLIPCDRQSFSRHWVKLWFKAVPTIWDHIVDFRASGFSFCVLNRNRYIWRTPPNGEHRIKQIRNFLGFQDTVYPRVWLSAKYKEAAREVLSGIACPIIVIAPFATSVAKQWPLSYYIKLCDLLCRHFNGEVKFLIRTTRREHIKLTHLEEHERYLILPYTTDLGIVAACMSNARLCVGNDSGIAHLSAALGAPTLTLFGPSCEKTFRPWGEYSSYIRTPETKEELLRRENQHESLMTGLSPEAVFAAAIEALEKKPKKEKHISCVI